MQEKTEYGTGTFPKPTDEGDPEHRKKLRTWKDADNIAFLRIRKNCDESVIVVVAGDVVTK